MKHLICLLACLAAPAAAQELSFDMGATEACLNEGNAIDDCAGASAGACMDRTPGGYATVVMGACFDAEWQVWDQRLNAAYQASMAEARRADTENGSYAPSQAEALRAMQRSWISFRDAKCDYVRSQWGGGTGGGPASVQCMMLETARQTLFLQTAQIGE